MKTVLIVDDDDYTLEHWGNIIERLGFEVLRASTGEEGVQLYEEKKPDVVFLDLVLPNVNGEEVFKRMKKISTQAKIYVISGSTPAMATAMAHDIGADGYITKPLMLEDTERILGVKR